MNGNSKSNITREKPVNRHYLFVKTGYAYDYQVVDAFIETFIRHDATTKFKVSLVTKEGKTCAYANVRIEKE